MSPDPLRVAAQHESGHAVAARVLGIRVLEVHVTPHGRGRTLTAEGATPAQRAIVLVAGDVQARSLGLAPYEGACSDLRAFEDEHGLSLLWRAEQAAAQLLAQHQHAVQALADRLTVERRLTF